MDAKHYIVAYSNDRSLGNWTLHTEGEISLGDIFRVKKEIANKFGGNPDKIVILNVIPVAKWSR